MALSIYYGSRVPGTVEFTVKGRVNQLWLTGKEVPLKEISVESGKYLLTVKHPNKGVSTIVVSAKPEIGYEGPAFFVNLLNLTVVWVLSHWEIGPISVH